MRIPNRQIQFAGYLFTVAVTVLQHGEAQTLSLSSATGTPGSSVTLNLALNAVTGSQPSSLQWTVGYSSTDFSSVSVATGSAASAASKTVSCVPGSGQVNCVLWGDNATAISNGVVATVTLGIASSAIDTSSQVQLTNGSAAGGSGTSLPVVPSGNTVTIQQPPGLNGFTCSPNSILPPAASNCTVQLSGAAGSGGAAIALTSSPTASGLPAFVTIPQGSTSASFSFAPAAVATATLVTLNASYRGATESFGVTVNPPALPNLTGISVTPSTIASGQTASGTITLSGPAPAGMTISLASSNTAVATVPATVSVAAGASTAAFTVTAQSVTASTGVTITASGAGTASTNLTIAPAFSLSLAPAALTVVGGSNTTTKITLASASGFTGTVNLAITGLPSGVTASFSPAPISGTASSTLTFTASASAATGNFPFTVTGSSGGIIAAASGTLTVIQKLGMLSRWYYLDIGNPALAGAAGHTSNALVIQSGGTGIGGTSDQFTYAFVATSGNFTVTSQLGSQQNTNAAAQAGLMFRESNGANARYVYLQITPSQGTSLQYRSTTGGAVASVAQKSGVAAPSWVRLVRSGNQFTGYTSSDGKTWTQLGAISVAMNSAVSAGIAVSSENAAVLSAAGFSSITAK